jgi:hypothetical protein
MEHCKLALRRDPEHRAATTDVIATLDPASVHCDSIKVAIPPLHEGYGRGPIVTVKGKQGLKDLGVGGCNYRQAK